MSQTGHIAREGATSVLPVLRDRHVQRLSFMCSNPDANLFYQSCVSFFGLVALWAQAVEVHMLSIKCTFLLYPMNGTSFHTFGTDDNNIDHSLFAYCLSACCTLKVSQLEDTPRSSGLGVDCLVDPPYSRLAINCPGIETARSLLPSRL